MGTITLSELRDETKFNLRGRSDAGLTDARLNRWVNAAYFHMCLPNVHPFTEMKATYDITLATGDNDYSISQATVGSKVVGVRSAHHILATGITAIAQKRKLSPRDIRWFDRRTLVTGAPTVYAQEGEVLYVHPVPTSAENGQFIRMRYWKEPTALSADGDTTVLASYYDEVLILGAQMFAERGLGYGDRAEATKQNYVALLNEGPLSDDLEADDWDFQVDVGSHGSQGQELL